MVTPGKSGSGAATQAGHDAAADAVRAALAAGSFADAERRASALAVAFPASADAHNLRGSALRNLGRLAEAAEAFAQAVRIAPDIPELRCNLGLCLKRLGRASQAIEHLRFAAERAPRLMQAGLHLQQIYQAMVPRWHFTMLHDTQRNDAFERALREVVRPGQRVLDIGTGSGLLAMMAARAGAGEVIACEAVPAIAAKAREIVAANGLADRVRIVAKPSTRLVPGVDLSGPADVLVSEIFDAALIGEGALATFEDAWARLLAPDAVAIPRSGRILAQPVRSPGLREALTVGEVSGFDLSGFNEFASRYLPTTNLPPFGFDALADPVELFSVDFSARRHAPAERSIVVEARQDGPVDAILVWCEIALTPSIGCDNAPGRGDGPSHWGQMVQLVHPGRRVRAGDAMTLVARHDTQSLVVGLG